MLGVILTSIGTLFEEISAAIGKTKVNNHEESLYTMGFLQLIWALIFFVIIGAVRQNEFVFSLASLPTFSIRAFFEIIQLHMTLLGIIVADRATFGFIRVGSIPLLLAADLLLGYSIGDYQIAGIGVIIVGFLVLLFTHCVNGKGLGIVIFTTVNAVITISLYKYDITRYNSVEAEQGVMYLILICYFLFFALFVAKENPFKFLKKPIFFFQSLSVGVGSVLESFAFIFAPASVIIAAKRSSAVLWSVLSGNMYFKEKHIILKLFLFLVFAAGIFLLMQ